MLKLQKVISSTKSKKLSTNNLDWNSPIEDLLGKRRVKTSEKLKTAGIQKLKDLLWIFPLRVLKVPGVQEFSQAHEGEYFRGRGTIVQINSRPNFYAKGKGRAVLRNITATVRDVNSYETLIIKWFNSYASVENKLRSTDTIDFLGIVSSYQGQLQISNPEFSPASEEFITNEELKIEYPTVATVSGNNFKKILQLIPTELWDSIPETLPKNILNSHNFMSASDAFKIIHAKHPWSKEDESVAKNRLIYEEFFIDQAKIYIRRKKNKKENSPIIEINKEQLDQIFSIFPYALTSDQIKTIKDIEEDLSSGSPMMRLIQGDVGSGKTSVAISAALIVIKNKKQVAFMCPTESLALQHYLTICELLDESKVNIKLLLGSTKNKDKKLILKELESGEINLIIGTHSLFQDSVKFKNLALAIIDEQHKFGVEQRIKLIKKGIGTHSLIMTATPIPRSLSLTQYGDLDISVIKQMPSNRRGHQTRIVTPETLNKFMSFLITRLELGEQAYIVVPAIKENEQQSFFALEQILDKFKKIFPSYIVEPLHGQMSSEEKENIFKKFKNNEINILISTSVVEVGINVLNATVMGIMNPERFGLSSLHQLRGRVGRGEKPGFFFLITDKNVSPDSLNRLKVIESTIDGFKIAEEDLKIRGQGDLFGKDQSGQNTNKKLANIITHSDLLEKAKNDFDKELEGEAESILNLVKSLESDLFVQKTI